MIPRLDACFRRCVAPAIRDVTPPTVNVIIRWFTTLYDIFCYVPFLPSRLGPLGFGLVFFVAHGRLTWLFLLTFEIRFVFVYSGKLSVKGFVFS